MEVARSEEESTILNKMISQANVLCIGSPEKKPTLKKTVTKHDKEHFDVEFRQHLGLLLLGTRSPIDVVDNWHLLERFGAAKIKEDNKPRRYRFYRLGGPNLSNESQIINGPTYVARLVMDEVKKLLSGENWVSRDTIEMPFKTTIDKEYYNDDQYIRHVVYQALDAADHRMFRMVRHLHKEYVIN